MSKKSSSDDQSRLISLPEAAAMYGFNAKYLAQLANRGRLAAKKIGGIWLTTPEDMDNYISSRQKRGAYRDDIQID